MLHRAVIGLQPVETQARRGCNLAAEGNGGGRLRHARAAMAQIAIDEHADLNAGRMGGVGDPVDALRIVRDRADGCKAREVGKARQRARGHNLVGDQNIANAAINQHLRLADFLATQAHGPGGDLHAAEDRRFVCLAVRAQFDARFGGMCLHAGNIATDGIEIDDQGGRFEGGFQGFCFLVRGLLALDCASGPREFQVPH